MILDDIVSRKKIEIEQLKQRIAPDLLKKECDRLAPKEPVFLKALHETHGMAVIAEIKKKSPSKGILRQDFDPIQIALAYEKGGAAALSILTDEHFFAGSGEILKNVRQVTQLPILRKDFILEEAQVYESRLLGADAILLIAAILTREELQKLSALARKLGLDVLFEVHDEAEWEKTSSLKPALVGINNRNLKTFEVDMETTSRLAVLVPEDVLLVSESGVHKFADIQKLEKKGVRAVLVGESLMKEKDCESALLRLRGKIA